MVEHYAGPATVVLVVLVVMALSSVALSVTVLIRLPVDYLEPARQESIRMDPRGPFFRMRMIVRNVVGALLILIGVVLSLPGVPGQGVLTVLVGFLLMDFPGKHRLVRRMLSRPPVLKAVNRLRQRFSRPPLVIV